MAETITLDELLAAMKAAGYSGDEIESVDGMSSTELAAKWGLGEQATRKILRHANYAGVLKVSKRRDSRIDGGVFMTPVYTFALPDKKPKRARTGK